MEVMAWVCNDTKCLACSYVSMSLRVLSWGVQGWQWLDEDWHIDMTGHEDACVDNEGWYYAVDFNWLKHPPATGSGRFKRVVTFTYTN